MKYFLVGLGGMMIIFYGSILYNTWNESLFAIIWPIINFSVVPFVLLIYFGIGRNL
ncbi:MAG: hypothetical protein ACQERB_00135 [Promethearchaeati archaeon]